MDVLEEKLAEIERALGVNEFSEAKPGDVDLESIKKVLEQKGCSHVLKVPGNELRRMKDLLGEPNLQPLDEKLNTVQYCSEMIRKRVELLEQWKTHIMPVLQSEAIAASPQHAAALEALEKDMQKTSEIYQREIIELLTFRDEFKDIMNSLNSRLENAASRIRVLDAAEEASS
ncbi:unnamed protein product, partial [Mesorhabditis spiculigera]